MEERIIFGPAIIPDFKIYRKPNEFVHTSHYVYFTKEVIEIIRNKFHTKNYENNVNINHDGILIQNVKMIRSFLINQDTRESLPNEFKDLPDGTWMIAYKVEDDKIWEMIEARRLNGFSVEGIFEYVSEGG